MKKYLLLIIFTIGACFSSKAQYNPYFDALIYSAAAEEIHETYRLNNIRFDENALRQNSEVWAKYNEYLTDNSVYKKHERTFSIIGWTGVGVMATSFIPLLFDKSDSYTAINLGYGLLGAGTILSCVGLVGLAIQVGNIKNSKKEFIYYLKTTNNGVGIVTLF